MTIDNPYVKRLVDEVTALTGESPAEAVRHALEERRERLQAAPARGSGDRMPEAEVRSRLAALDEVQALLALTPAAADAWVAEVRAERDAHRLPGDEA